MIKTPLNFFSPPPWLHKKWVKNSLTVLVFLAIYLVLRSFMQGEVIHGQAPIMKVQTITGKTLDLQAFNLQGKPVLVHIWATWCPICDLTKGGVESVATDYPVINIATQSGSDDELLAFAHANDMNPNIIVNDVSGKWMQTFGAKAVPADFIIAPNGDISFIEVGFTSAWGLRLRLWWAGFSHE
ncbi:MAG: redoxin domain-containing protein [Thiomicrorhabdus sp.]|nr:redoxin domain-containing protein [Thiomicrorhabdus sp.]